MERVAPFLKNECCSVASILKGLLGDIQWAIEDLLAVHRFTIMCVCSECGEWAKRLVNVVFDASYPFRDVDIVSDFPIRYIGIFKIIEPVFPTSQIAGNPNFQETGGFRLGYVDKSSGNVLLQKAIIPWVALETMSSPSSDSVAVFIAGGGINTNGLPQCLHFWPHPLGRLTLAVEYFAHWDAHPDKEREIGS